MLVLRQVNVQGLDQIARGHLQGKPSSHRATAAEDGTQATAADGTQAAAEGETQAAAATTSTATQASASEATGATAC